MWRTRAFVWRYQKPIILILLGAAIIWTSLGLRQQCTNETAPQILDEKPFVFDLWTPVQGLNDTYVFNAYFTGREDFVRIVGVGPSNLTRNVKCVFPCARDTSVRYTMPGTVLQMIDSHGKRHNNIEIRCTVPNVCRTEAVSVAGVESSSIVYLKIHYPPRNKLNEQYFSICTPTIHSNYSVFTEIVQSFEVDSLLGAQRFTLYYMAASPEVDAVLRMYIDSGILTVIRWNLPEVDVHYFAQVTSVRDCFYRNMHTSRYIAFKDFDEVLFPYKHENLDSLISDILKKDKTIAAFIFRNSFVYKGGPDVTDGVGQEHYDSAKAFRLNTILKQYRQTVIWPGNYRSKFIVDPNGVDNVEIHMVKAFRKGFKGIFVNETLGLMYHYKTFIDQKIPRKKDQAVLRLKDRLLEKVDAIYAKLNNQYTEQKPLFP